MTILTPDVITRRVRDLLREEALDAVVDTIDVDCNAQVDDPTETPPIPDGQIFDGNDEQRVEGDLSIEIFEAAPDHESEQALAMLNTSGVIAGSPRIDHAHRFSIEFTCSKQDPAAGTAARILWRVSTAVKFLLLGRADLSTTTRGELGGVLAFLSTTSPEPDAKDETRGVLTQEWAFRRSDFQ